MYFHSQINDFWVHEKLTECGILIIVSKTREVNDILEKKQGSSLQLTEISREVREIYHKNILKLISLTYLKTTS